MLFGHIGNLTDLLLAFDFDAQKSGSSEALP